MTSRSDNGPLAIRARGTTVPRWFAVTAAIYGSVLTFLAVAFVLGSSTWSRTHTASALADGVEKWWPTAVLAAAVVAVLLAGFGIAASRTRRARSGQRISVL